MVTLATGSPHSTTFTAPPPLQFAQRPRQMQFGMANTAAGTAAMQASAVLLEFKNARTAAEKARIAVALYCNSAIGTELKQDRLTEMAASLPTRGQADAVFREIGTICRYTVPEELEAPFVARHATLCDRDERSPLTPVKAWMRRWISRGKPEESAQEA